MAPTTAMGGFCADCDGADDAVDDGEKEGGGGGWAVKRGRRERMERVATKAALLHMKHLVLLGLWCNTTTNVSIWRDF